MLTHAYIRNDVLYTHGTSVCSCSQFGFLSAVAALNCICPRTRRWHWGGSSLQVEYENGILVLPIADTCFVYLCFYRALRYTLRSGSCQRVLSLDSLFIHRLSAVLYKDGTGYQPFCLSSVAWSPRSTHVVSAIDDRCFDFDRAS